MAALLDRYVAQNQRLLNYITAKDVRPSALFCDIGYIVVVFLVLSGGFVVSFVLLASPTHVVLGLCPHSIEGICGRLISALQYTVAILAVQLFLALLALFNGRPGGIEVLPGLVRSWRQAWLLLVGFLITTLGFAVAILLEAYLGWSQLERVSNPGWPDATGMLLAWMVVFAQIFWEELLFRGSAMQFLRNQRQEWIGGILAAFIFAICHQDAHTIGGLLYYLIFALLLFGSYQLTRSLWLSTGVHFAWNLLLDTHAHGTVLWQAELTYPAWWLRLLGDGFALPYFIVVGAVLLTLWAWHHRTASRKPTM